MAQILLKKPAQSVEEQEDEFIVLSPVEPLIPKSEISQPQAKAHKKVKKELLRLFNRGKKNAKYLEELADMKRLRPGLDAPVNGAYRNLYF